MKERPIIFSGPMVRAILEKRKTQTRRVIDPQPVPTAERRIGGVAIMAGLMWDQGRRYERYGATHPEVEMRPGPHGVNIGAGCEFIARSMNPYGAHGDRLWVREGWRLEFSRPREEYFVRYANDGRIRKLLVNLSPKASDQLCGLCERERWDDKAVAQCSVGRWRPSIHMFRWASRLTLEVGEVRVQRLQEISEADAIAEGLRPQEGDGGGPGPGFKWKGVGYEGARRGYFHIPDPQDSASGRCGCNVRGPSPAQCAYRELWDSINGKRAPWNLNPWVWTISFRRIG